MIIQQNNVHTKIVLEKVNDKYKVMEDIQYNIMGTILTVPKGFITDLASIPTSLQGIIPKQGLYDAGAILHDYLYSSQSIYPINRYDSDRIFHYVMVECGVDTKLADIMYNAVRIGGESHYQRIKDNGYIPQDKSSLIDKRKIYMEYVEKRDKLIPRYKDMK